MLLSGFEKPWPVTVQIERLRAGDRQRQCLLDVRLRIGEKARGEVGWISVNWVQTVLVSSYFFSNVWIILSFRFTGVSNLYKNGKESFVLWPVLFFRTSIQEGKMPKYLPCFIFFVGGVRSGLWGGIAKNHSPYKLLYLSLILRLIPYEVLYKALHGNLTDCMAILLVMKPLSCMPKPLQHWLLGPRRPLFAWLA